MHADDALAKRVMGKLRDVPDFPRPGVLFKDITPILTDPRLFGDVIDWMSEGWRGVDRIVGIESRGFLFGAAMMGRMGVGLGLARKKGKLPFATVGVRYDLEYGSAELEMHVDAVERGQKVVVVDDLLATGGTAAATIQLCRQLGAEVVGVGVLVELAFLDGRQRLDVPVRSLVTIG
jgi:adenine phosphoribosyltransferase